MKQPSVQWNVYSGQQKKLYHYFENNSTKEFITALMLEENLNTRNSGYLKTRGKKGKTGYNKFMRT